MTYIKINETLLYGVTTEEVEAMFLDFCEQDEARQNE